MLDVIIILIVCFFAGLAIWYKIKQKREGAAGCGCGCSSCASSCDCRGVHKEDKKKM